jgi:hypothetical protein
MDAGNTFKKEDNFIGSKERARGVVEDPNVLEYENKLKQNISQNFLFHLN